MSAPKAKGRLCSNKKCKMWYRPSKYRSAGPMLEYCSLKCLKKVQAAAVVRQETRRD